jgi:hypothetical protein
VTKIELYIKSTEEIKMKKIKLINGILMILPSWCIREKDRSYVLETPHGERTFAKWYVESITYA